MLPLNFTHLLWKRSFNLVSRASLIRGSTSLIEFAFSFYFDKSRKSLQRWVVGMRTKAEIAFWLDFRCSGMLISDMQKSAKTATFASKNRFFCTFTELDFSTWQGCTGYRANLKVCTYTKKVDNHCFKQPVAGQTLWASWAWVLQYLSVTIYLAASQAATGFGGCHFVFRIANRRHHNFKDYKIKQVFVKGEGSRLNSQSDKSPCVMSG